MNLQFCKKSLDRLGADGQPMLASLRELEHSIVIKDCLDRCQACDKGLIIASAGGMPVSAVQPRKLLATVAALAADD